MRCSLPVFEITEWLHVSFLCLDVDHHPNVRVHFVFLSASEELLMDRVRARRNHYMKDYMVHSQFESLETPQADEVDVLSVDASGMPKEVQELALGVVEKVMAK